jgi:hypothetical protein
MSRAAYIEGIMYGKILGPFEKITIILKPLVIGQFLLYGGFRRDP